MNAVPASATAGLTRRAFVGRSIAAGGAFTLGFHVPVGADAAETGALATASPAHELNAWVVVKPDESVVIRIARSEMGQGSLTGLAQLVAEELDCDWARVSTEFPSPGQSLARNRAWGSFSTGGSRGIRESQDYVRKGGAAARLMLVGAAADEWRVPASECSAAAGVVRHARSGRSATYGQLCIAAAQQPVPGDVKLRDPKDWKIAGKRLPRLDTAPKLDGSHVYSLDLKLPGMLNAAIRACPVTGGTVKRFDAASISGNPGVVKVVPVGNTAVAVVADTWWHAKKAIDALAIEWDEGPNGTASSARFAVILRTGLDASDAFVGNAIGDARTAIAGATRTVSAVYSYPHQAHATMEVMNATARWTPERCEVWAPTQNGETALQAAAEAAGLPPSKCEVYKLPLGGGFGRRGTHDWLQQAVEIARQLPGRPVKLIWSREEDMTHDRYHPVTQCRLVAGLDAGGKLVGLHMRLSGQSIFARAAPQALQNGKDPLVFQGLYAGGSEAAFGYAVPHLLIDHAMRNPHVLPGVWRGVNLNQNAFYLESFIDEIAVATRRSPLQLRRELLAGAPKALAVLEAVAARAQWDRPAPPGTARGLAQIMGFGSYVAASAEVSVSDDGEVKVHRIVAATDPGHAVNPQQIEAQVEGSFAYGLSASMLGGCTVKAGRIEQQNFDTYPVLRLREMPAVETIVMPSGGFWGGVGEPTIAVATPAVLNAVFAATGKRIRDLPLKLHDLKAA